jgi:hypothetical protein
VRGTNKKYFIIKLRQYASEYHLERWLKFNDNKGHLKHIEACKKHQVFFEKLYEHLTGNKYNDLFYEYGFSIKDCASEIIESDYGILLPRGEGWQKYLIPKDNQELIDWFMDNKGDIPFKILKKTNIWLKQHEPSTYWRDTFRLSEEMKHKLLNGNNKTELNDNL